jgi:hypothetical protein
MKWMWPKWCNIIQRCMTLEGWLLCIGSSKIYTMSVTQS